MNPKEIKHLATAAGSALMAGSAALGADAPKVDTEKLDAAFEALKTYDWGPDRNRLNPIDEAIVITEGDAAARADLEKRLVALLGANSSRATNDYIGRKLKTIGTATSVPALAALLPDAELSHMARYALERIPAPEAAAAMRDALPKLDGEVRIGVIGSLGARADEGSTKALVGLLGDSDAKTVGAAATALGAVGAAEAATALTAALPKVPEGAKATVIDGCFRSAEQLAAGGKKVEAMAVYKALSGDDQPKHVRLGATRGLMGVMSK